MEESPRSPDPKPLALATTSGQADKRTRDVRTIRSTVAGGDMKTYVSKAAPPEWRETPRRPKVLRSC
jgi:hypothetical protein